MEKAAPGANDATAPGRGVEAERRAWLGLLARARPQALAAAVEGLEALPRAETLRGPEIGTVMVRGRAGGTGAPFNLGEMTVTRCTLRLPCGTEGHAMVQGRDRAHAHGAAMVDALMQTARADEVRARVLAPLGAAARARAATRAARAAGTRVEFFTLVRGETA